MRIGYEDVDNLQGNYENGEVMNLPNQGEIHMREDYQQGPPVNGNYQDEQHFARIMDQREYRNLEGIQEQAYYNDQMESDERLE